MHWYKKLGPGLLYAGAAIGVSHLVQSTRAGALYGFDLFLVVLLVNLIKYPFFEASGRFVAAEKENLLEGYSKIHPAFLFIFLLQTFVTMFIVQAAVTVVTAGLLIHTFGIQLNVELVCVFLFGLFSLVLFRKKLSLLDQLMKPMMFILVLCTVCAFFMSFGQIKDSSQLLKSSFEWSKGKDLLFLAALIGWMPSPLDCTVWHSVWTTDKIKETKQAPQLKEILFDLRFSYALVILLALIFLSLGALIMHTREQSFSSGAVSFASELIKLYQDSLGPWSSKIVSLSCLITMVSTSLSCWDAFSRVMSEGTNLLLKKPIKLGYQIYLVLIAFGSLLLINFSFSNMKSLIDFATTVAFVIAPLIAFLTLKLMMKAPKEVFPSYLKIWATKSSVLLLFFSLAYLFLFAQG